MSLNIETKLNKSKSSKSSSKKKSRDRGKSKAKRYYSNATHTKKPADSDIFKILFFVLLGLVVGGGTVWLHSNRQDLSFPSFQNIKSVFSKTGNIVKKEKEEPKKLCVQSSLSQSLQDDVGDWNEASDEATNYQSFTEQPGENCDIVVSIKDFGSYDLAWKKYYTPIVNRTSSLNNLTREELEKLIGGNTINKGGEEYSLTVSKFSKDFLEKYFGLGVTVPISNDILGDLKDNTNLIGIVPFEDVDSKYRVLSLDGINLFGSVSSNPASSAGNDTNEDDSSTEDESGESESGESEADEIGNIGSDFADVVKDKYFLTEEVWLKEPENLGLFSVVASSMGPVNYNPEKVTTVVTTGTSVMGGRGLYHKIREVDDPIYPIRDVAHVLQEADVAHVSNEAAFIDDCVQYKGTLTFCGSTESFEAFKFAGIDVIGLTGNHLLDAGEEGLLNTLELYENAGMQYFGGGRNLGDARKPAIVDVNGLKFAFLGYNAIPPAQYFATDDSPGSLEMVKSIMVEDIQSAKEQADFVFVDMQWGPEYQSNPIAYQIEYGRVAVDAGADFVIGVHPHWVQPVEYYRDGVIFYSLGNFLFDQMWAQRVREGVMIRHIFYDKEYMGFEAIPTMIFESAQPRIATGSDAQRIRGYLYE